MISSNRQSQTCASKWRYCCIFGRFAVGCARLHKYPMRPRTAWFHISHEIGTHACTPNLVIEVMHNIYQATVTFRISGNGSRWISVDKGVVSSLSDFPLLPFIEMEFMRLYMFRGLALLCEICPCSSVVTLTIMNDNWSTSFDLGAELIPDTSFTGGFEILIQLNGPADLMVSVNEI